MQTEPFIATLQLLERHKIRLTREVYDQVPALAKTAKSVAAIAVPGRFGGIQVLFGERPFSKERLCVESMVRSGKCRQEDAGESWTLAARYLTNAWRINFNFYENRYTVVLPKTARDLGLVPQKQGEVVLLFQLGEIFEIWPKEAWIGITNEALNKMASLSEDLEELETDNSG